MMPGELSKYPNWTEGSWASSRPSRGVFWQVWFEIWARRFMGVQSSISDSAHCCRPFTNPDMTRYCNPTEWSWTKDCKQVQGHQEPRGFQGRRIGCSDQRCRSHGRNYVADWWDCARDPLQAAETYQWTCRKWGPLTAGFNAGILTWLFQSRSLIEIIDIERPVVLIVDRSWQHYCFG